jgi:membrane protease YdiL (CAAX protease family)
MEKNQAPETFAQKKMLPWSPLIAVVIVIATYFGAQYGGAILLVAGGMATGMDVNETVDWLSQSTFAQFLNSVVVYGMMAFALYLFIRRYKTPFRALGWVRPRLKDVGIALLGVMPYFLAYFLLLTLATNIFPALDVEQEQELGFDTNNQTAVGLALTFISLVVLPPIVEELVVRGFLFTSFLKRFRFLIAALCTSVVFAAAHLQFGGDAPLLWVAAIDTFALSMVLCYMRYKTGSLWAGIFLHAMKNGVAFTVLFLAPYFGWQTLL